MEFSFSALAVLVGRQEGHATHHKPLSLIFKGFVLKEVEEETQGAPTNAGSPG